MPVTAKKLKGLAKRWILQHLRIEANQGLVDLIGTFRELGMTDDEIRREINNATRDKLRKVIEDAMEKAKT